MATWRRRLLLLGVLGALLLVSCGGEDGGGTGTPAAGDGTPPAEETAPATDEGGAAGAEAFSGVPVPEGAVETESGTWTGSIPGMAPGAGAEPGFYSTMTFKAYQVTLSPPEVLDFYRKQMSGWEEGFSFSAAGADEAGSVGLWTRDGGKTALWVAVNEEGGATELLVILGSRD